MYIYIYIYIISWVKLKSYFNLEVKNHMKLKENIY